MRKLPLVAGALLLMALPGTAMAAAPSTVTPPGGGGCSMGGSGSPGSLSFTAHITDSCGYQARAYVSVEDFNSDFPYPDHFGNIITSTGSSKAHWGINDEVRYYGWEDYYSGAWHKHQLGSR